MFGPKNTLKQCFAESLFLIFQEAFEAGSESVPRFNASNTLNRDGSPNVDSFRVVIF
jgi:hypothetical protein